MQPELVSLHLYEVMGRIGVAFLLALTVALFKSVFYRDVSSPRFFFPAQILIAVIVATMMVAIDERLPRALGLFAALSIVRFRMPIKSLREMIFIFLAICIGICAGSGAFVVASVGTAVGLATLLFVEVFRENRYFGTDRRLLEVTLTEDVSSASLEEVIKSSVESYRETETRSFGTVDSRVYEIWVKKGARDSDLVQKLRATEPRISNVRLVRLFNTDESTF